MYDDGIFGGPNIVGTDESVIYLSACGVFVISEREEPIQGDPGVLDQIAWQVELMRRALKFEGFPRATWGAIVEGFERDALSLAYRD